MNFCSDCKWGKLVEDSGGLYIYCIKPVPESHSAPNRWVRKLNVRKKLSAQACGNFVHKQDDFADC